MLMATAGITRARDDQEDSANREYQSEPTSNIIFTAYDCTRPVDNTYRSINLAQSKECRDFQHEYEEPEETQITLVQTNTRKVKVAACQLMLSKHLIFHGKHAHGGTFMSYVDRKQIFIDGEICLELLKKRKFNCPKIICQGKVKRRIQIPDNQTKTVSWYSHGGLDENSRPIREVFTPEGSSQPVTGAAEVSTLAITLNEYDGEADIPNDILTIPALNVKTNYRPSVSQRGDYGLLAWKQTTHQCQEGMSKILRSNATIYRRKPEFPESREDFRTTGDQPKRRNDHQLKGAVVILHNKDEDRAESVVVQPGHHDCLAECHTTNVRDLTICVGDGQGLGNLSTRPVTSSIRLNMRIGMTQLNKVNHLDGLELGKRMHARMCEENNKMSGKDLAAGLNLRNPYSLQSTTLPEPGSAGSTGRAITLRGVVGYIYECTPCEVKLVQLDYCTQQIPCEITDPETGKPRLAFADPVSFNLRDYPTKTPCTPRLPVQYLINGVYYCHGPKHSVCPSRRDPLTLGPFGTVGSNSHTIISRDTSNFTETFTKEQLDTVREIHERDEHGTIVVADLISDVVSRTIWRRKEGRPMRAYLEMPSTKPEAEPIHGMVKAAQTIGQLYFNILISLTILSLTQYVFNSSRLVRGAQTRHYEYPDMYPVGATLKLLLAALVFPLLFVFELTNIVIRALVALTTGRPEAKAGPHHQHEEDQEGPECPEGQEDWEGEADHRQGSIHRAYGRSSPEEVRTAVNKLIKAQLDELRAAERRLRRLTEALEGDSHPYNRGPVRAIREETVGRLEEKIGAHLHNIKKLREFLGSLRSRKELSDPDLSP